MIYEKQEQQKKEKTVASVFADMTNMTGKKPDNCQMEEEEKDTLGGSSMASNSTP